MQSANCAHELNKAGWAELKVTIDNFIFNGYKYTKHKEKNTFKNKIVTCKKWFLYLNLNAHIIFVYVWFWQINNMMHSSFSNYSRFQQILGQISTSFP